MRVHAGRSRWRPAIPKSPGMSGSSCSRRGLYTEAIGRFDTALALDPRLALVHCHRASTLAELRRFDEAFADYDKALALDPDCRRSLERRLVAAPARRFRDGLAGAAMGTQMRGLDFVDRKFAQPHWLGETDRGQDHPAAQRRGARRHHPVRALCDAGGAARRPRHSRSAGCRASAAVRHRRRFAVPAARPA